MFKSFFGKNTEISYMKNSQEHPNDNQIKNANWIIQSHVQAIKAKYYFFVKMKQIFIDQLNRTK